MNNPGQHLPNRRSLRLQGFDYRTTGAYFVTICTSDKKPLFGRIQNGRVELNELGQLAKCCWKQIERIRPGIAIDVFIVMPNHIHGILLFSSEEGAENMPDAAHKLKAGSLGAILGQYKSIVTKRSKFAQSPPTSHIWQRNFHDHIIRSTESLDKIRQYIVENPARWAHDELDIS